MQKTLVKVPIVLGGNWPWPSRSNLTSKSEFTPFWACPDHYSPPILVRISKFGQQMHFSTVKIPVNSGLDWPWTSPSFLIPKLFFSLWRCALRLWNSPWFVSKLFRDCFTVSTPVHMGNAQPKWNGASSAVVLIWIKQNHHQDCFTVWLFSQYDCFSIRPCCAIYWSRWPRVFRRLTPLLLWFEISSVPSLTHWSLHKMLIACRWYFYIQLHILMISKIHWHLSRSGQFH